jgi:serine/threonine protein kinase
MAASVQLPLRISDRYEVGEELGQGLGSQVFRGEDTVLKRLVAIKLVPPESASAYRAALGATARVGHPAFIGIYDALEYEGQLAIIQEFINGQRFAELAQTKPSPASVTKMGRQLALALAHAHRLHVVHGDLVPAALFRDQWGAMRINNLQLPPDTAYFAAAGTLLKPGDDLWVTTQPTPRDDLRAMGVVLWLLLAGRDTIPAEATGLQEDWQLVGREVPPDLRDIIERLIDPEHPHALDTAEEVIAALQVLIQAEEDRKPRRGTPPWSSSLPRLDTEQTRPAAAMPTLPEMVPVAAKPAPAVGYPAVVGGTVVEGGDDEVTWVSPPIPQTSLPSAPLAHATRPHPLPARGGRLDYLLWAVVAMALFLFWLIIGYLVPGLLGK